MRKLVLRWMDDEYGPFVVLARADATERFFVEVRYVRPAGYWQVFAPDVVVRTSRAQRVNCFGNLASAWRFARSCL